MSDELDTLEEIAEATDVRTFTRRQGETRGSKQAKTTLFGRRYQGPLWRRQLRGLKSHNTRRNKK